MPIYLGPRRTARYMGEPSIPQDVQRRRRASYDLLRRLGTPVLVKHRFNDRDFKVNFKLGKQDIDVVKSPVYDNIYEQTRNDDPLSHGVGYVSAELSLNEWFDDQGTIVVSHASPGVRWTQAPKYRGFGPGNLTYIIEPDRAEDFYKSTTGGPIFKVQTAQAIAPWWPDINDNDLIIQVIVDKQGNVVDTNERFEAKNVSPVSMRGTDRQGRKENGESFGNSHTMNQVFEMSLIPETDVLYNVETDR